MVIRDMWDKEIKTETYLTDRRNLVIKAKKEEVEGIMYLVVNKEGEIVKKETIKDKNKEAKCKEYGKHYEKYIDAPYIK